MSATKHVFLLLVLAFAICSAFNGHDRRFNGHDKKVNKANGHSLEKMKADAVKAAPNGHEKAEESALNGHDKRKKAAAEPHSHDRNGHEAKRNGHD